MLIHLGEKSRRQKEMAERHLCQNRIWLCVWSHLRNLSLIRFFPCCPNPDFYKLISRDELNAGQCLWRADWSLQLCQKHSDQSPNISESWTKNSSVWRLINFIFMICKMFFWKAVSVCLIDWNPCTWFVFKLKYLTMCANKRNWKIQRLGIIHW